MAGPFCLFDVSRSLCHAQATKNTSTFVRAGDALVELTEAEWAAKRDANAARMFRDKKASIRVSPTFENPQACASWLTADPANVRDAKIMVRAPKLDKLNNPIVEKGLTKMTWRDYKEECRRLKIPYVEGRLPKYVP